MSYTMADKIWDAHLVRREPGRPDLIYIDLHLMHEMTSPQAFEGLRSAGRPVRRPELTVATEDHNVPTAMSGTPDGSSIAVDVTDPSSRAQLAAFRRNCHEFGNARSALVHIL